MTDPEPRRERFDVVVAGAGLVGAALACALANAGARVAVVEPRMPPREPPPEEFDLRVSAFTLGSRRWLDRIGAWCRVPDARIGLLREMRVWDASSRGAIHFDAGEVGVPALGYVAENRRIADALEHRLDRVSWFRPARVRGLECNPEHIAVTLAGSDDGAVPPTRLAARLLVGADGTDSAVRGLAGIQAYEDDYRQRAVVATVRTGRSLEATAWQRFLPAGPLAFLPLPGERASIVWSTGPAHAARLLEMQPEAFGAALGEAIEGRLGPVTLAGGRAAFGLRRLSVARYVGDRLALIGDAAHTIHPLAGQGVNLGLLDAATLAELVGAALEAGRDPGSARVLRRYERWRKSHNLLVQGAMEALHRLFASRQPAVRGLRGAGMSATGRVGPLKRRIMRFAMGIGTDSPQRLADGG